MLEELRITGLGVIEDAVVELYTRLSPSVTGETGAGKTMVVTSLGLLLGGRADPALVRIGAGFTPWWRAGIDGGGRRVAAVRPFPEAGGQLEEDGALLCTRSVSAEGRSRAFAGGRAVPVWLLG